ncbi:ANTAR domain-containing response regulator [Cohnella lupini]|uniref:Response regulator NasT n=1 Tax=Cohnella lupini TaxID=1294267 RepID=A0A3D9IVB2_9BACL|nr:ANTAR domain-containing protein [Cohnella lupini]RED65753.1 response regulator NasT [Cohnella lupini]
MRSLLVVHNQTSAPARTLASSPESLPPEFVLRSHGYIVTRTKLKEETAHFIVDADAVILQLPISEIKEWSNHLLELKQLPLLWWCDETAASESLDACEDDVMMDGLLTPSMVGHEIHWTLHFSAKQFMERRQWHNEREQLLGRIEERKWIDMAKSILCEIKNVTESEAYDILRKQAMNERKRMVDVATSIVKVYQLLQENKGNGAKRK